MGNHSNVMFYCNLQIFYFFHVFASFSLFIYHTILPETLEKWSLNLLQKLLPRHAELIEMIEKEVLLTSLYIYLHWFYYSSFLESISFSRFSLYFLRKSHFVHLLFKICCCTIMMNEYTNTREMWIYTKDMTLTPLIISKVKYQSLFIHLCFSRCAYLGTDFKIMVWWRWRNGGSEEWAISTMSGFTITNASPNKSTSSHSTLLGRYFFYYIQLLQRL